MTPPKRHGKTPAPSRADQTPGDLDLLIVGAGAAGMMAAVAAAERGLHCLLLESRHRPGQKLLLCGNNRCNVTHDATASELVADYGEPVGAFLEPAVQAFPPAALCQWFADHGLRTTVHADRRVFPASEKADDVVHCFRDALRQHNVPLALNCPVVAIHHEGTGYRVTTPNFSISTPRVLLATGGVSYPKTGSVGDGQRFAKDLGHRISPYRPGLAGIVLDPCWLPQRESVSLPDTELTILHRGQEVGRTTGEILLDRTCARGPAMVNASRIMARLDLKDVEFLIDLFPKLELDELVRELGRRPDPVAALATMLPRAFAQEFAREHRRGTNAAQLATALKAWRPNVQGVRPLKEAMVTVGGVVLEDIDPATMESRNCPGLFFAGEIADVDGPTGGYNLHAAFATARLAVDSIAKALGRRPPAPAKPPRTAPPPRRSGRPPRTRKR